jgi:integrase
MRREVRAKLHGAPHLVPLPKQAVSVLRELKTQSGSGLLVFRGERHHHRAMSENTINAALRAMGFPQDEVTGHGFRATARTMLQERLGFDAHVIEGQLAHTVRGSLGRAYNRTEFVEQRRKMLQAWADYLDKLRCGAPVLRSVSANRETSCGRRPRSSATTCRRYPGDEPA